MPRQKSYDRQNAITKACNAFWEHGFQSLGVRELERLTGLNQFAIRSEFGGKEGLYLETLNYYCDAAISAEMAPMKQGGIPEIVSFFKGLVTPGSMTSSDYGCLIVNTGIENARIQSPRLENAVRSYWNTLEDHFLIALENEQAEQGEGAAFTPHILAASLVPAVMGIHAHNRSHRDQTAGRPLVDLICSILSGYRPL
ncbi:TetR/AcrR family transcriptional regulator [Parasulfitobacter algicola]|uniref:TetR/AcrR family transcriptional regulator n=1 Tax=Parasulfitobacter algicola TaxID=2614809 RepID=A0ABX2IWC4_9RHOB|nr:TetR/AcrR family transcriptional regulator [Sulfitobacter algicola]NSX56865.1 TetR/AcrR family transcriptional regulator [Sulfitobacter algicola]